MSDKSQQEPSIEDILASIRRIISDDAEPGKAEEGGAPPAASTPAGSPAPDEPDDVLELTDVVEEEPPAPPPPRPPAPEVRLDMAPEPEPEPAYEPPPPREPERPAAAAGAGLLSAASAAAAASSLSRLASKRIEGHMPVGTRTVEDLVMELLRPMLQEWVDDNLPQIVEQLVERELRRLSDSL